MAGKEEDKTLARKLAVDDMRRFLEHVEGASGRRFPIIGPDDPPPDVPGDGEGCWISILIGTRGDLTRQAAKRSAKNWRRHVARYPKAHYILMIAGYDHDPRNLWEIPEAGRHVCRFARFAGIRTLEDADRHLDQLGVGFLAACGAFGEEIRRQVEVPPPVVMQ